MHHLTKPLLCGRRDVCDTQQTRAREQLAPKPLGPPRRSNRACVARIPHLGGQAEMPRAEEADESKTEDDWIPGKSLTHSLWLACLNARLFAYLLPFP